MPQDPMQNTIAAAQISLIHFVIAFTSTLIQQNSTMSLRCVRAYSQDRALHKGIEAPEAGKYQQRHLPAACFALASSIAE
jgi:hypothetical protein